MSSSRFQTRCIRDDMFEMFGSLRLNRAKTAERIFMSSSIGNVMCRWAAFLLEFNPLRVARARSLVVLEYDKNRLIPVDR